MYPSNPVAVRATRITNAPASSGSTSTDLNWVGSVVRRTAARVNIDKQIHASNHPPRMARKRPPHQPSAAPAARESRLPNGNTQRAIRGAEKITHPTRNASPATATEIIADSIHRLGKSRINNGQNK